MATKYFIQNAEVGYFKTQSVEGTRVVPDAIDAIKMIQTPTLEPTFEISDVNFTTGDPAVVESFSFTKDVYAGDVKFETLVRALPHGLDAAMTPTGFADTKLLNACAFSVEALADAAFGFPAGTIIASNKSLVSTFLSADARKVSALDPTNDKLISYQDLSGTLDLKIDSQDIPRFTWNFKGTVNNDGEPTVSAKLSPIFREDKYIASIRTATIQEAWSYPSKTVRSITCSSTTATVTLPSSDGFTVGDTFRITGVDPDDPNYTAIEGLHQILAIPDTSSITFTIPTSTGTVSGNMRLLDVQRKNPICFHNLNATNIGGHELQRFISSCTNGFVRGKVPSEVMLTIQEDQTGGTNFDPDANRMKNFGIELKFGKQAGEFFTVLWDDLQLKDVKPTTINNLKGRDITYVSRKHCYMIWS